MSCSECAPYGLSSCPMCEVEPVMVKCDDCHGEGYIYYDDDGNDVAKEEYEKFPEQYTKEVCCECGGYGEVEDAGAYYDPDEKFDSIRNGD